MLQEQRVVRAALEVACLVLEVLEQQQRSRVDPQYKEMLVETVAPPHPTMVLLVVVEPKQLEAVRPPHPLVFSKLPLQPVVEEVLVTQRVIQYQILLISQTEARHQLQLHFLLLFKTEVQTHHTLVVGVVIVIKAGLPAQVV